MSLFSVLSIGASGMQAQRTRAEMLVENLANTETTRTPEGGPYRRKDAVFESTTVSSPFSSVFNAQFQPPGGGAFQDVLSSAIQTVESFGHNASASVERFLSGEGEELHTTVLATQQAELSFEMFMQARNKVVNAYQEIMRMQV